MRVVLACCILLGYLTYTEANEQECKYLWSSEGSLLVENAKFSFHGSGAVLRLQYISQNKSFPSTPSVTFVNSQKSILQPDKVNVSSANNTIIMETAALRLLYRCNTTFRNAVKVQLVSPGDSISWRPPSVGLPVTTKGNLNGSVQTTDCYVGADRCREVYEGRFQPGLISRSGYEVVDDSGTAMLEGERLRLACDHCYCFLSAGL